MSFIYIVLFCIFTDAFYPICRAFHSSNLNKKKTDNKLNLFFPMLEERNYSFNIDKEGFDMHIKENKIYEYTLLEQIAIYQSYMILVNRLKLPSVSNEEKLDAIYKFPITIGPTTDLQNKEIQIVNIYSGGLYNNWNDSDIKYN